MINHFSHRHPLKPFRPDLQSDEEEDQTVCSGCEIELSPDSDAFSCTKPGCDFRLHELCYELPREIRHVSHAQHPLALLYAPPPSFSCSACSESGTAFAYACATCHYGLHVQCCALPESVLREDRHRHVLRLVFRAPRGCVDCGVCGAGFFEGRWAYLCGECGYGNHLECAIGDGEAPEEGQWVGAFEDSGDATCRLGVDL